MKLNDWKRLQEIVREGYFENCSYLPTKLTDYPYVCSYDTTEFHKKYGRHTTVRCDEVVAHYYEECTCSGREVFPTYAGRCDFWQCHPVAIKRTVAKQQALYARKYGKLSYTHKHKFKPCNKLQFARYIKTAKIWGWDK